MPQTSRSAPQGAHGYCKGRVVSEALAGTVELPPVPLIVSVEFPRYVEALYAEVRVSVEVPEVLIVVGENCAVTPAGSPVTASVTGPVNP
jgi:hypothetical protein